MNSLCQATNYVWLSFNTKVIHFSQSRHLLHSRNTSPTLAATPRTLTTPRSAWTSKSSFILSAASCFFIEQFHLSQNAAFHSWIDTGAQHSWALNSVAVTTPLKGNSIQLITSISVSFYNGSSQSHTCAEVGWQAMCRVVSCIPDCEVRMLPHIPGNVDMYI